MILISIGTFLRFIAIVIVVAILVVIIASNAANPDAVYGYGLSVPLWSTPAI